MYCSNFKEYKVKLLIHMSLSVMKPLGINLQSQRWNIKRSTLYSLIYTYWHSLWISKYSPIRFLIPYSSLFTFFGINVLNIPIHVFLLLTNNQLLHMHYCQWIIITIIPLLPHMQWLGIPPKIHVFYRNDFCLRSLVQYLY